MKPFSLLKALLSATAMSFLMAGAAHAAEQGTAAEAEAMVHKAAAYVKANGPGWSEPFKFRNPTSEKMEEKVAYIERVGDIFVGCGIYKK